MKQTKDHAISIDHFPKTLPNGGAENRALYLRVYDAILSVIVEGKDTWEKGTELPPEQEFVSYWNVSRGTIREALYHLIEDGVIQKSQGKKSTINTMYFNQKNLFNTLSNPVFLFCSSTIDHYTFDYSCVGTSEWLASKLSLNKGAPLVKGRVQYFHNEELVATAVFFTPFSFVEIQGLDVNSTPSWLSFFHEGIYEKSQYAQTSICLIDEVRDSEIPDVKVPLLLMEEFLYDQEKSFMFIKYYLHKDSFRINMIRKNN